MADLRPNMDHNLPPSRRGFDTRLRRYSTTGVAGAPVFHDRRVGAKRRIETQRRGFDTPAARATQPPRPGGLNHRGQAGSTTGAKRAQLPGTAHSSVEPPASR